MAHLIGQYSDVLVPISMETVDSSCVGAQRNVVRRRSDAGVLCAAARVRVRCKGKRKIYKL